MCLIIDTNTFRSVTNTSSANHRPYSRILQMIQGNRIKVTIGGTRYKQEIFHKYENVNIIQIMNARNQLVKADDAQVDAFAAQIKKEHPEVEFDDDHIVALASVTSAKLVTTEDTTCIQYLNMRKFYDRGCTPPKVFNHRTPASFLRSFRLRPLCRLCK